MNTPSHGVQDRASILTTKIRQVWETALLDFLRGYGAPAGLRGMDDQIEQLIRDEIAEIERRVRDDREDD